MSGLGGNLTYPTWPILINTLAATDLGVFGDGVTSKRVLLFKKHGITIPYDSNVSVTKSCTEEGQLKSVAVTIDGACPCEDCDYEYGIDIVKRVKEPGVLNDDFYFTSRHYGGKLASIGTCSGGELADADKLLIENDLITQITNDTGNGGREAAIVDARRVYIITTGTNGDEEVSFYDEDGVLIFADVVLTNNTNIAGAVNDLNADTDFDNYFYATAISSTQVMISSINPGLIFTIEDGGGAHAITVASREIWLTSKSVNYQFDVRFDYGFATVRGLTLQALDATTNTAGTFTIYVDGNAVSVACDNHTVADFVGYLNAATFTTTYACYACQRTTGATTMYIYAPGTVENVTWASFGTTGVVKLSETLWGNPLGMYPKLTSDDVFRVFSQMKNLGAQSTMVYQEAPTDGSKYCKITFQWVDTIANLHGASHGDTYHGKVVVYLKQGNTSALWEAAGADTVDDMMAAGTSSTLTAMLNKWSGVYGTSIGTLGTTLAIP